MKFLVIFSIIAVCQGALVAKGAEKIIKHGRIIGGDPVNINDAPYQLQLQDNGWPICGATIISDFFALTTASCVYGYDQRQLTLRAGTDRHQSGGRVYQVYKINIHPLYDDYFMDYDIALLELATPFRIDTSTTKPILLATEETTSGTATVTGWGRQSEEGYESNQLLSVEIPIIPRANCTMEYAGDITERMICAGVEGKDACRGDTGGPLAQNNVLVGIVSWSYGCARDGFPGVYVNITNSEIQSFIASIIAPEKE